MKKCSECNIDMIENIEIEGQHPFELGMDGQSKLRVLIPRKVFSKMIPIKSRICPQCGKVELYINPEELQKK